MSATIIPDIYRHTARKSTVSRSVKSSVKSVSTFLRNHEQSTVDTIQCDIKLEKDHFPLEEQTLLLLPSDAIEQMVIERTDEQIVGDILEELQNRIQIDFTEPALYDSNLGLDNSISVEIQHVLDALMTHFDTAGEEENMNTTNNESIRTTNDVPMDDTTRSLIEGLSMESDRFLSISRVDDEGDIVEIEATASDTPSQSCICQCHQRTSDAALNQVTNDYLLFERVLRQTRQEQQQERLLNNNRIIQILKRQHEELVSLYQRQLNIHKIDREQQTVQVNQQDSQIQTDILPISQQQQSSKPTVYSNGTHPTSNVTAVQRSFNSSPTPIRTTGPSLQQLIPCLTTNKVSILKKPTPITPTAPQPIIPSVADSHDIVDLTEEDDDDNSRKVTVPSQTTASTASHQTSASPIPSATIAARLQPTNRSNSVNTPTPLGQTVILRPLPDYTPCDLSIARPQLSVSHDNSIVRLTWNLPSTPMESIQEYEIYAYKHNTTVNTSSDWKKIGGVKSMRLPMAVTLKEFQLNSHYAFAVRAVTINNKIGPFCEAKLIFTGNAIHNVYK